MESIIIIHFLSSSKSNSFYLIQGGPLVHNSKGSILSMSQFHLLFD